jgi:hypothetical protein
MNAPRQTLYAGRGFARRRIELACELYTSFLDVPLLAWGTNLSESGIFLETDTSVFPGEDVVISFRPSFGWNSTELTLFAEVARASTSAPAFAPTSGVGLRFLDLSRPERCELSRWLRPRDRMEAGMRSVQAMPSRPLFGRTPAPPAMVGTGFYSPPVTEHPFASRVS